ncbi:MAG: MCE family protein [Bacteroidales bacterium]|nr:MCE family protein [Candidatus Scybalousia scybalohippi]
MKVRTEFQIGLIGLITIVVLILGVGFLKGGSLFSGSRTYYAIYDNVSGMHESNYIYINGLKVGYVSKITPMNKINDKFLVTISVDKGIDIPVDSKLTLFSDGLLGGMALKIEPGKSTTMLNPKDTLLGYVERGLMDNMAPMMGNLSSILARIDTLTATLNKTIDEQSSNNIKSTLENINSISARLDNVAKNVDGLVAQDKHKLDKIVSNVESITSNLSNNNQAITNIINRFDNITDTIERNKIGETLASVNSSLQNLNTMLNRIEKGKGNVGMLINDEGLYNNINSAAKNLDLLIQDLKANPKKYINVSVF